MGFRDDERGQAVLVGAILLFAMLIIAFSSYQAFIVPNQNAEVEFNHNQQVQNDMQDLRNSLLDIRSVEPLSTGGYTEVSEHRPVGVRLGTQFPERLIALNPPQPSGTIETVDPTASVRIENVSLAESSTEFEEDPSVLLEEDLETTFLQYSPQYTEYQNSPDTVLEHSFLYNDFGDAKTTVRQQTIIRPGTDRINIVLFEGDLSQTGSGTVTLDPETVDGPTTPIPIEDDGDITIQIPTQSPTAWTNTIEELEGVSFESPPDPDDDRIRVVLDNGQYDLRVTKVSFDGGEPDSENTLTDIQRVDSGGGSEATDPRIYDTNWDPGAMENDNIEFDDGTLLINKGEIGADPIDGFINVAEVDPPSDPIFEANVDIGSTNVIVADPPDENGLTNESGTATTAIDIGIGNARLFASAGDDADQLPIDVRANIEGIVRDGDGDPISDATVEVEETEDTDTTNPQGEYALIGISANTYNVTADANGFNSNTSQVDVSDTTAGDNGIVTENFTLEPDDVPAELTLSNLNIAGQNNAATITEGEEGDVEVDVTNDGDESGAFTIGLDITNGETVTAQETTGELGPGDTETVMFTDPLSGLGAGEYDVTVADEDGISSVTGTLTVEPAQDGLELEIEGDRNSATIENGETIPYQVFRTFTDGSEEEITDEADVSVSSSDIAVVSVNEAAFEITGESGGTTTIIADDGEFTATVDVTVSNIYEVVNVEATSGGGNDIDVTFEIDTTDPNAQVNVQSLESNGDVRDDTGLINVEGTQPQTVTIGGGNQATQVRVILYDGNETEQDRGTIPYP